LKVNVEIEIPEGGISFLSEEELRELFKEKVMLPWEETLFTDFCEFTQVLDEEGEILNAFLLSPPSEEPVGMAHFFANGGATLDWDRYRFFKEGTWEEIFREILEFISRQLSPQKSERVEKLGKSIELLK